MLGIGWNVVGGWAGQFDFGPQVFFAVGAYTAALLFVKLGVDAWLGLVAAVVVAVLICAVLTYPLTRLRGHYFAIATVAIWMIAQPIGATWEFIGGSQGLLHPGQAAGQRAWPRRCRCSSRGRRRRSATTTLRWCSSPSRWRSWRLVERSKLGSTSARSATIRKAAEGIGIDSRLYKVLARSITAAVFAAGGVLYAFWALAGLPRAGAGAQLEHAADHGHRGRWHRPAVGPVLGAIILIPIAQIMSTDARHRTAGRSRRRSHRLRPHHRPDRGVPADRAAVAALGALVSPEPPVGGGVAMAPLSEPRVGAPSALAA